MSRKQAIRKIRITASVALGVLCVLLIGLYVRSHYYLDSLRFSLNGKNSVHIQTASGRVALFTLPHVHPTRISHVPTSNHPRIDPFYKPITGGPSATEFWSPARRVSPILSYWLVILPIATLSIAPWIRRQFSLRTLLIAITLVAVILGAVVIAAR